jgi:sugar/nucleoside kinase (ribokinase family)
MKLVCLGDCGIDHYETTGDRLPGGIAFNFALQARRVFPGSDEIRIVSALGTDSGAVLVRRALETSGVVFDLTTLEGATPVQHIALEPNGERRFVGYDVGVLERFRPSAAQTAVIEAADWLVMPHYAQIAGLFEAVLRKPRRGALAVDFADFRAQADFALLERSLEQIDLAFFGLQAGDASMLTEIERLAREHDRLLVATLGPAGSCAYSGGRVYRQAAIPVPAVVDTTGAGDAFAAGFLSRHCHGAPVAASLAEGARLAAAAIQQMGGAA